MPEENTKNPKETAENPINKAPSNIDIVDAVVQNLILLQDRMDRAVDLKRRYQLMMFEPQTLFMYRRPCIAFLAALQLFKAMIVSQTLPKQEDITNHLNNIRIHDKDLARQIENLLPKPDKRNLLFSGLITAIWASKREGTDYLVNYISTHMPEMLAEANAIEDPKTSRELKRLFAVISGRELQSLEDDAKDCDNWVNLHYAAGSNMAVLKRRVELYLRGGYDGNTQFMGLLNDFGDRELAKNILGSEKLRNLWRYQEQVAYLESLIEMCRKSETPEGKEEWLGFFGKDGFWGTEEDEKGKNFDRHANEFLTKYGNKDFRDTLMTYKFRSGANPNGIGQSPEGWGGVWQGNQLIKPGFLHVLLRRLQHPTYQRQRIIVPAAEELKKLFGERAAELKGLREKSIKELVAIIKKIKGAAMNYKVILAKLRAVLVRKKRVIVRELIQEIAELERKFGDVFSDYTAMNELLTTNELVKGIHGWHIEQQVIGLENNIRKNAKLASKSLSTWWLANDWMAYTRTINADESIKDDSLQIPMLRQFEHLSREELLELIGWVKQAQSIVSRIQPVNEYIRAKLEQNYTLGLEQLQESDFDKIEKRNPKSNIDFVRKSLNHVANQFGLKIRFFEAAAERAA